MIDTVIGNNRSVENSPNIYKVSKSFRPFGTNRNQFLGGSTPEVDGIAAATPHPPVCDGVGAHAYTLYPPHTIPKNRQLNKILDQSKTDLLYLLMRHIIS